jgi:hypothetical protein
MYKSYPYLNVVKKSTEMDLLAEDSGKLNLIIPRNILDSMQANGTGFSYIIVIEGAQVESQETTREESDQLSTVGNSRGTSIFVPPALFEPSYDVLSSVRGVKVDSISILNETSLMFTVSKLNPISNNTVHDMLIVG